VLVTGVGQGFGRAIALGWGRAGFDVVCADRDVDLASKTAAEVEDAGGQAIPIQIDVSVPLDVNLAFSKVDELYGRLDGIVHVATRSSLADALTVADSEFRELVDDTLMSTHIVLRTAGRRLQQGFVVVVGPSLQSTTPHNAMIRGGLEQMVLGFDARLDALDVNLVLPSRNASDPRHDAALVDTALFVANLEGGAVHGAALRVELPKPPSVTERLLPEIQAALDDRIRQDDLEAGFDASEPNDVASDDDDEFERENGDYESDPGPAVSRLASASAREWDPR